MSARPEPHTSEVSTAKCTKKVKLTVSTLNNVRRMILAFENKIDSEINWAINSLLLLSCNPSHNYQLELNGLAESIVGFIEFLADSEPKYSEEVFVRREHMISILVILRNLSMIRNNEILLYKTPGLIDVVVKILHTSEVSDVILNCLEILAFLGKHIFLADISSPSDLLSALLSCLKSQFAEQTIEVFRKLTLPISNEELIEQLPQSFYDELARWIIVNTRSKDSILEILCNLSDQSLETRTKIADAPGCIQALVQLLGSASLIEDTEDRTAKMAALILNNLCVSPKSAIYFEPYQMQLFLVAASDERLCGLISPILYAVNQLNK